MRRGIPLYPLFSVVGLELEYAIVDGDMWPACLVEDAFRRLNGRPTSDLANGAIGFSNELAAHVFEVKMLRPQADLVEAERHIVAALREFLVFLRTHYQARLLPTGMHPFMRPRDTRLWARAGRRVYESYARLFCIREHGWLNVQSCHVNLPFGTSEKELVALHNAVSCVLPYLPALSASSPIVEGKRHACLDARLAFYRRNQRKLPMLAGEIVPEFVGSVAQYRREVLAPIYRELRTIAGTEPLRHEWVNSRGAILRFARQALEIRLLDTQECVRMDVAMAIFLRATLRRIVRELSSGELQLPEHQVLVSDLSRVIERGRNARVQAPHFAPQPGRAAAVIGSLLERARPECAAGELPYLDLLEDRLTGGSLAERILARAGRSEGVRLRARLRDVYEELILALENNRPWEG